MSRRFEDLTTEGVDQVLQNAAFKIIFVQEPTDGIGLHLLTFEAWAKDSIAVGQPT